MRITPIDKSDTQAKSTHFANGLAPFSETDSIKKRFELMALVVRIIEDNAH